LPYIRLISRTCYPSNAVAPMDREAISAPLAQIPLLDLGAFRGNEFGERQGIGKGRKRGVRKEKMEGRKLLHALYLAPHKIAYSPLELVIPTVTQAKVKNNHPRPTKFSPGGYCWLGRHCSGHTHLYQEWRYTCALLCAVCANGHRYYISTKTKTSCTHELWDRRGGATVRIYHTWAIALFTCALVCGVAIQHLGRLKGILHTRPICYLHHRRLKIECRNFWLWIPEYWA